MKICIAGYFVCCLVAIFSCTKDNKPEDSLVDKGDIIVGTYNGTYSTNQLPESVSANLSIAKTSPGEYRLTSNAPFSSFNLSYDAITTALVGSFTNSNYYKIPMQINNGVNIDSSSLDLYKGDNSINFMVRDSTKGMSWNYTGRKQ